MSKPCQDCYDAYHSAWEDSLVMLHRGCMDLLIIEEQEALARDAKALWAAVDKLPVALWTDDIKTAMPCLARTMDKGGW